VRRWVVTGPIGAGKSLASAHLASRGAAIVDGDALGHELLRRPAIRAAVVREFGPGVERDGRIDRSALGAIVFADPAALARLDALTHGPLARLAASRLDELAAAGRHVLAVFEAAVYFLLPSPPLVDLVVVVTAPADLRAARLAHARGLDAATARARIAAQGHWEPLWARADRMIVNDGNAADLARALDALWRAEGLPDPCPPTQGDP
jgi:dephospho-CoA kinase